MAIEVENDSISMKIQSALSSILHDVEKAIANGITLKEAMTETIVIDPILAALGYAVWEYQKQGMADSTGTIPDYTILPQTPRQWFLEVKRWRLPLTDKEANQTVGYAFSQGSRWAILTNGDEWRIYDAYCNAHLTHKCIYQVESLSSPEMVEMLTLLAKEAMQHDLLALAYRARLVVEAVKQELTTAGSETIRTLRKTIQSSTLPNVTKEEVLEAIGKLIQPTPFTFAINDMNTPPIVIPLPDNTITPTIFDLADGAVSPSSKTVFAVLFPDSSEKLVNNWREVTVAVVEWCFQRYELPELPFTNGLTGHATRYFLHTEPVHADGEQFVVLSTILVKGQTIYIYLHNSARGFCRILSMLMNTVGGDPAAVRIRMR